MTTTDIVKTYSQCYSHPIWYLSSIKKNKKEHHRE